MAVSKNKIGGLQIKPRPAYTMANIRDPPHPSDNPPIYAKGEPEDLIKHSWYHGNITKEQADAALRESDHNRFLVRASGRNLVLSMTLMGWRSHDIIHYSPKGYRLDGEDKQFESVSELITHFQHHPIKGSQVLGTAIATVPSVRELEEALAYEAIPFRKGETVLNIQWKKICDLPVARTIPQVVKIGNSLYAGGGTGTDDRENVSYKFDVAQETWSALPPCPTYSHALTTLNSELIAIGGTINSSDAVSTAYTLRSGEWIEVLPPMPTPRYYLAAASHDNRFIIAAGGTTKLERNGVLERTQAVEIYTEEHHVWYSTNPLSFPVCGISMCIINTTCYILGCTEKDNIMLTSSLDNVKTSQPHVLPWKQLKDKHPLFYSSSVELNGRLFTMGGSSHPVHRRGTRYISTRDFTSTSWIECKGAKLPISLYRTGVVKLDSDHVMIVGGQSKPQQYSAAAFIGYLSEEKLETLV